MGREVGALSFPTGQGRLSQECRYQPGLGSAGAAGMGSLVWIWEGAGWRRVVLLVVEWVWE